jgi:NitT/TauT family transport system substrate-binding protein
MTKIARGGRPSGRGLITGLATGVAVAWLAAGITPAAAEVSELRVAQQFGISYLPLTIMQSLNLIEQEAGKLGVKGLKVTWAQLGGGSAMNEALLSGSIDYVSGGIAPLLTLWSKTKGRQDVKAVSSLNSMPLYLNTVNPDVKSLKDFTGRDRIGLPAVKVSIQAVTLEMAAEQAFGVGNHAKLDPLTVSMKHPDGMMAMMSGRSEITGHFTSAPYMYQELADPRVHRVVNSFDVLGGPATFNVVWAAKKFHDANPLVNRAFLAALGDAVELIKTDPHRAAEIYLKAEPQKMSLEYVEQMLKDPENIFTMVPQNTMKYADFMARIGVMENRPQSWQDLFFPEIHDLPGS